MSSQNIIEYPKFLIAIPQFLHLLVRLLTDEPSEMIEWSGGQINIYKPNELAAILQRYYRHSNLSSFHRQLSNYGFRKNLHEREFICFVNDQTSKDIDSILKLKVITTI